MTRIGQNPGELRTKHGFAHQQTEFMFSVKNLTNKSKGYCSFKYLTKLKQKSIKQDKITVVKKLMKN